MNYVKRQSGKKKKKKQTLQTQEKAAVDWKLWDYKKVYTNKKLETFDFQYLCSYLRRPL